MKFVKFKSEQVVNEPEEIKYEPTPEHTDIPVAITLNTKRLPRKRGEGCINLIS